MFLARRLPSSIDGPALVDSARAARLWLPRTSLASCVRGVVLRDTTVIDIDHAQVRNCYPAAPTCCLAWFLEGTGEELLAGPQGIGTGPVLSIPDALLVNGPFNRPLVTRYPRPVRLMVLMLLPDAFELLTGITPSSLLNRFVAADSVLDDKWMRLMHDVEAAPDDDARVALIEHRLDAWWQEVRQPAPMGGHMLGDWYQSLTMRAYTSSLGRSARQVERRVKQWTGQPLRELRGISRSEKAFFHAATTHEDGDVDWAALASDTGFTDQSHMCRQSRRLCGFSPVELRRLILEDEGFWAYRLWGFSEARQMFGG